MKLTITPTAEFATVNGAPCRIWTGTDDAGTEIRAWIAVVQPQTHDEGLLAAFEAELRALPQPRTAVSVDMRFVVD